MGLGYTYWEAEDGFFVGYLNDYPDHLTQGHNLAELEEMLADVYQIRQEEEKRLAIGARHTAACGVKLFRRRRNSSQAPMAGAGA